MDEWDGKRIVESKSKKIHVYNDSNEWESLSFWPMSLFHRRQVRRNTRCRMFCPVESNLYFRSHCQPDDPVHYYTSLTWMTGYAMLFPESYKIQLYTLYNNYIPCFLLIKFWTYFYYSNTIEYNSISLLIDCIYIF